MLEFADTVLPKTYAFNIAALGAAKIRAAKMPGRGRQIGHLPDRQLRAICSREGDAFAQQLDVG